MGSVVAGVVDEIFVPVVRLAGFAFEVVFSVDFDEPEARPKTLVPFEIIER